MGSSDRIEKRTLVRAPRARVWRALTRASEFGAWFRAEFTGEFVEGKHVSGRITYPGYEHLRIELFIERMQPEALFSFRWHPHAVDPHKDYGEEPTTLVEFRLEDAPEGTALTLVESGFDRLPAERRELAFRMNGEGWTAQLDNVKGHVEG
jgi:uncharacterized protein YndB with AHSA1/START domain